MPKSIFEMAAFHFGIPKSNGQREQKFPICEPISSPENGNLSDAPVGESREPRISTDSR
jgi:hypothetical protein